MNPIPMLDLKREYEYMKKDIDAAITRCLEHQQWIKGPEVAELEEKIAEYLGVKHCIGVASGTDALVISLRALAIKLKGKEFFDRDDEIITTPFTFVATGDAILRAGATPVFVDIDPNTLNIDPSKIRAYLEEDPSRVVGILPVHLYGNACDMDAIMDIASERGLFVVEDAAQAMGGAWDGKKLGSIGDAGTLSFFPSKNLGGFGDGGMIATNDEDLATLARILLQHGGADKYNVNHIGYNSRLDTMQAAILLTKFNHLEEMNERRRSIAKKYNENLQDTEGVTILETTRDICGAYSQYTLLIQDDRREDLRKYLGEMGILTAIYYPVPLHHMEIFKFRAKLHDNLKESEIASKKVLSLPAGPFLEVSDIESVMTEMRIFFTRYQ